MTHTQAFFLYNCMLNLNACKNQNQSHLLLGERAGAQLRLAANLYVCSLHMCVQMSALESNKVWNPLQPSASRPTRNEQPESGHLPSRRAQSGSCDRQAGRWRPSIHTTISITHTHLLTSFSGGLCLTFYHIILINTSAFRWACRYTLVAHSFITVNFFFFFWFWGNIWTLPCCEQLQTSRPEGGSVALCCKQVGEEIKDKDKLFHPFSNSFTRYLPPPPLP